MEVVQLLVSGLANGCIYGLIALGFVLIYKVTEQINFAQGDLMALGAFIALGLGNAGSLGLPFALACLGAILLTAAVGWSLERVVLRPVTGQSQMAIAILTIALGFLLRFVIGAIWGHDPRALESPLAGEVRSLAGLSLGLDEVAAVPVTLALVAAAWLFFRFTRTGTAMRATSQNQLAACHVGISVHRMHGLAWAMAGALAAVAGILFASRGTVDPGIGLLGIKAFAAAVIGGFGSLPGALLGGLVVGLVEPFAARYLASGMGPVAPYALLFLVLVLRPHGLVDQLGARRG